MLFSGRRVAKMPGAGAAVPDSEFVFAGGIKFATRAALTA
jgi:hypothetical protein